MNNISQLFKKDYPTISLEEKMVDIVSTLKPNLYFVVLNKEREAVGLITWDDILQHPHGKVKDCNYFKPCVSWDCKIVDVFTLMEKTSTDILPVYDGDELLGVISLCDLTKYLLGQYDKYNTVFQKVVHDLRNPISSLLGLNALLGDSLKKPENIELVELTKEACNHALDILNELLLIEKLETAQSLLEITELNSFAKKCLKEMTGIAKGKGIEIFCDMAEGKFNYLINRMQFKRALQNIISNAIKFSNPNEKINIYSNLSDNKLVLKIRDIGIGIPMDQQSLIFDQFTGASRSGTGGNSTFLKNRSLLTAIDDWVFLHTS